MKTKLITIDTVIPITQLSALLAISIAAPLLQHQLLTGSIVNGLLFSAAILVDLKYALLVAFLPSIISLAVGLLPFVLAPMIPFIILGNGILIVVFSWLKQKNYWLSVLSASLLKFIFLWSSSSLIIKFFIAQKVAPKIAIMFSWPQLTTALLGGIIAYLVLKISEPNSL